MQTTASWTTTNAAYFVGTSNVVATRLINLVHSYHTNVVATRLIKWALHLHGFESSGAILHPLLALAGVRELVCDGFREQVIFA